MTPPFISPGRLLVLSVWQLVMPVGQCDSSPERLIVIDAKATCLVLSLYSVSHGSTSRRSVPGVVSSFSEGFPIHSASIALEPSATVPPFLEASPTGPAAGSTQGL